MHESATTRGRLFQGIGSRSLNVVHTTFTTNIRPILEFNSNATVLYACLHAIGGFRQVLVYF